MCQYCKDTGCIITHTFKDNICTTVYTLCSHCNNMIAYLKYLIKYDIKPNIEINPAKLYSKVIIDWVCQDDKTE